MATASASVAAPPVGVGRALVRRGLRDARTRTLAFAYLFAIYAYIQPVGYRHTYSTAAERVGFAHSFAGNKGLRLIYGQPFDVVTVEGYSAWRVGGTLAIAAAAFGVLAAVRALRAEEDTGRMELVLAAAVGRRTTYVSAIAAIAAGILVLWAAELAGFVAGGLAVGGSAYLALAMASVAFVFAGLGAVASQIAPSRRIALGIGGIVAAVSLLLRVVADTVDAAAWLRWATPLGWAEELRPFTGVRPLVLLLPVAATACLFVLGWRIAARRDLGTGLIDARDSAPTRLYLLSSPIAQALRAARGGLLVWSASIAVYAAILGVVSESVSSADISEDIQRRIEKLGTGSIATPTGYLALIFIFFILAVSLFACAQVGSMRSEEEHQRLETLLSQPIGRTGWFCGRLLLAAAAAALLSAVAGFFTWAGAASAGVDVSLARMLEAGANCLPVSLLFLGLAALGYALVPRAGVGLAYGLVSATFVWQLVGSLVSAPQWLIDVTPFEHVGLVPTQSFRLGAAAVMVAIGVAGAAVAAASFRRRDLLGS
jgi:ABC-2 type transport system permease protein